MELLFDLVRVVGWTGVAGGVLILAVVGVHAVWKTAERVSLGLIRGSLQRGLRGAPGKSRSACRLAVATTPSGGTRAPVASRQEAC